MTVPDSDVAPVQGTDVAEGHRLFTEHGTWSSPITHFKDLPADYWGTQLYGWTRVAYAGDIPIGPIAPSGVYAIRVDDEAGH